MDLSRDAIVGLEIQGPFSSPLAPLALLSSAAADLTESLSRFGPARPTLDISIDLPLPALASPHIAELLGAALEEADLDPAHVWLEIEAADVVMDVEHGAARLRALREVGVQLAIDGFGAVGGSLGLLKRLPVQALKVDAMVIARLGSDRLAESTALALASLAQSFDLVAIAQGVVSEDSLRKVRALAFDRAQGPCLVPAVGPGALAGLPLVVPQHA